MIVYDLHVVRVAVVPAKHDSPPVVDSDRVVAAKLAFECFEPGAGWDPQIAELICIVQIQDLATRSAVHLDREPTAGSSAFVIVQVFCKFVAEAFYHLSILS